MDLSRCTCWHLYCCWCQGGRRRQNKTWDDWAGKGEHIYPIFTCCLFLRIFHWFWMNDFTQVLLCLCCHWQIWSACLHVLCVFFSVCGCVCLCLRVCVFVFVLAKTADCCAGEKWTSAMMSKEVTDPCSPQLLVWSHEDDRWWLRSSSSSCVVSPSHKSPSTNLQKLQKRKKYIGQTETALSATCIRRHIYLFRLIIAIVPFNVEEKIKLAKDGMMSATLSASAIKCSSPFLILPAPGAWCKYGVRNNWNIKLFYQLSVTSSPIITPSSGCLASFCSSYWGATIYTQPNPRKNETLLQN